MREHLNRRAASVIDSASATSMIRNRSTTLASCLKNAMLLSPPVMSFLLSTFGVTKPFSLESYGTACDACRSWRTVAEYFPRNPVRNPQSAGWTQAKLACANSERPCHLCQQGTSGARGNLLALWKKGLPWSYPGQEEANFGE